MPSNANTQADRTAIRHTVPWRLTSVTALPDARLHIVFVDGTNGEVHLAILICPRKLSVPRHVQGYRITDPLTVPVRGPTLVWLTA